MSIIVSNVSDVTPLLERVRDAATRTARELASLTASELDGLQLLRNMKFTEMAWHPLDERPLNLIEQINQTWTCVVTLRALPFLFMRHPDVGGFRLNLGAAAGTDIVSLLPNAVAAETFAAVRPNNNRKLAKDISKLVRECPHACARYVFFAAPGFAHERQFALETEPGIEVWGVEV
jgi:hypothetical protein